MLNINMNCHVMLHLKQYIYIYIERERERERDIFSQDYSGGQDSQHYTSLFSTLTLTLHDWPGQFVTLIDSRNWRATFTGVWSQHVVYM